MVDEGLSGETLEWFDLDRRPGYLAVRATERDVSHWNSAERKGNLNVVDSLTPDKLKALAQENNISLNPDETLEADLRRKVAVGLVRNWLQDKDPRLESDITPFDIMTGRYEVGKASSIPESPFSQHLINYQLGDAKEKMGVLNELYRRYWALPPNYISHLT